MEEKVAAETGDIDVRPAVVVVVAHGRSHAVEDPLEARLARHVAECGAAPRRRCLRCGRGRARTSARAARGSPGHQAPDTKSRSGLPSPSKSRTATPPPIVSGIHFSPRAPLTWTKSIPIALARSSKRTETAGVGVGGGADGGFGASVLRRRRGARGRGDGRAGRGEARLRFAPHSSPLPGGEAKDRDVIRAPVGLAAACARGSICERLVVRAPLRRLAADRGMGASQVAAVGLVAVRADGSEPEPARSPRAARPPRARGWAAIRGWPTVSRAQVGRQARAVSSSLYLRYSFSWAAAFVPSPVAR